jgi:hypothetical protein
MTISDTVGGLRSLHLKWAKKRVEKGRWAGRREAQSHEPAASNVDDDAPSLVTFAARALKEELGIEDQMHCDVTKEVLCVSINLDRHEAFPFITAALFTRYTREQIKEFWRHNTADPWEADDVLALPWNKNTAKGLANGEIAVPGVGKITAASPREPIFFAQAADALGVG